MGGPRSAYSEIIVRIIPARRESSQQQQSGGSGSDPSSGGSRRSYNVLIYTELELPKIARDSKPPAGQPYNFAGLPYAGRERIVVIWDHYEEFLAAFVEGIKPFEHMRARLLEAMPEGLESLLGESLQSELPVRIWWSCDTPELDDLPWELAAYRDRADDPQKFYFVRGNPPEQPVPAIPFAPPLRLALIHQPEMTHPSVLDALAQLPQGIQLIPLTGPPHKALEEVAREGYELVHIIADGVVSLAHEGILYFHGRGSTTDYQSQSQAASEPGGQQISPGELSSLLRGSRVGVVCLSTQDYSNPDRMSFNDRLVPSAYRAFTYLGGSRQPLPTVVAPLGPIRIEQVGNFWRSFYRNLADTFSPQQAFNQAQAQCKVLPVALFLRHRHDVLFRHRPPSASGGGLDPTGLGAALNFSHQLVEQLRAHRETYGDVPESISQFIDSEEKRQESLSAELTPWLESEEEQK